MISALCAGLICLVAVAAAAEVRFKGRGIDPKCKTLSSVTFHPCTIGFEARRQNDRVVKVRDFRFGFFRAEGDCGGGRGYIGSGGDDLKPFGVRRDRRFNTSQLIHDGDTRVIIRGRFRRSYRFAVGTIRIRSGGSDGRSFGCDTGVQEWRSHVAG